MNNIKFADSSIDLAIWCFKVLEAHGIHELKGLDVLKENRHQYLQLHLEDADIEILLEKVGNDKKTNKPIYRFVKKMYTTTTFTAHSAEFMLDN